MRLGQHFTDTPLTGSRRRRVIKNWANYREPNSGWLPSDLRPDAATGKPDHWPDDFTHQIFARRGPAQVALGNDPGGRPHVRVRNSRRPGEWAEFVWLGSANGSTPETNHNAKRIRWVDWKTNTNLTYTLAPRGVRKVIRLKSPGRPSSFRFAVKLPLGHSVDLIGGRLIIRDDQGVEYVTTGVPYAVDSSTTALTIDGAQSIGVTIDRDGTTARGWPIYKLTPDADDLAAAVYPVKVDPPVIISGTVDLEDAMILNYTPAGPTIRNRNYSTAWRDSVVAANGFVVISNDEASPNNIFWCYSTEDGAPYASTITLVYATGGTNKAFFFMGGV